MDGLRLPGPGWTPPTARGADRRHGFGPTTPQPGRPNGVGSGRWCGSSRACVSCEWASTSRPLPSTFRRGDTGGRRRGAVAGARLRRFAWPVSVELPLLRPRRRSSSHRRQHVDPQLRGPTADPGVRPPTPTDSAQRSVANELGLSDKTARRRRRSPGSRRPWAFFGGCSTSIGRGRGGGPGNIRSDPIRCRAETPLLPTRDSHGERPGWATPPPNRLQRHRRIVPGHVWLRIGRSTAVNWVSGTHTPGRAADGGGSEQAGLCAASTGSRRQHRADRGEDRHSRAHDVVSPSVSAATGADHCRG